MSTSLRNAICTFDSDFGLFQRSHLIRFSEIELWKLMKVTMWKQDQRLLHVLLLPYCIPPLILRHQTQHLRMSISLLVTLVLLLSWLDVATLLMWPTQPQVLLTLELFHHQRCGKPQWDNHCGSLASSYHSLDVLGPLCSFYQARNFPSEVNWKPLYSLLHFRKEETAPCPHSSVHRAPKWTTVQWLLNPGHSF